MFFLIYFSVENELIFDIFDICHVKLICRFLDFFFIFILACPFDRHFHLHFSLFIKREIQPLVIPSVGAFSSFFPPNLLPFLHFFSSFSNEGWDLMNHDEGVSTSHFDAGTFTSDIFLSNKIFT